MGNATRTALAAAVEDAVYHEARLQALHFACANNRNRYSNNARDEFSRLHVAIYQDIQMAYRQILFYAAADGDRSIVRAAVEAAAKRAGGDIAEVAQTLRMPERLSANARRGASEVAVDVAYSVLCDDDHDGGSCDCYDRERILEALATLNR